MTPGDRALVTISAAYGAGGSELGPKLAERLGVPFVDRAIPIAVAQRLEVPVEEAVDREEVPPATFSRWLAHFAPAVQMFAGAVVLPEAGPPGDDDAFRSATEQVLREYASPGGPGGVILGRAGAVILRDAPGALHVRLDGPPEARVRQAMHLRGIDEATAAEEQRLADRAREAYVKHWYRVDPHDPALYHLVLDSTELPLETCLELIVLAVAARS
jgi:cytidylate kinase